MAKNAISKPVAESRSRLGAKRRWNPDADVTEERRELKAALLEAHIKKVVDSLPPLSDEQRAKLALLLRPEAGA
ncbi:hypothetical protein [Streptomyces sp. MZ04]|uniref:hypothetical protein n=1 Tax=Streptomyces sp. MZ04 TaxID=2559236 RepID=UPI00107E8FA2|nr:hypothetical protein [Streptomyces sp. MZ04]TGA89424.1 hypothetical protein E2651_39380 [Streptomyces sp. MZ04]